MRGVVSVPGQLIERDAEAWGVGPPTAWATLVAPIAILATAGVLALVARPAFLALTSEDGLLEWSEFVVVLLVVGASAALGLTCWRHGLRPPGLFYALAAMGALFVALEEISWGQRVFDLVTPTELGAINRQGETNVHNIPLVQSLFGLAELAVAVYAVVASAVVAVRRPAIRHLYLVVPPLFLAGLFLVPALYRLARYTVVQEAGQTLNRVAEIAELMLYLGILVFVVLALRRLRAETVA
jgi:hypothetical protein